MVVLTKGKKRSLEQSGDEAGLKKSKLGDWDAEAKELFKKENKGSCWNFAETGECSFGEECRFNHVTRDGEMVQEKKVNEKSNKKTKSKEECIAEREIDEDDNIYTGKVKLFRKGYGFIAIEESITFKDLTAEKKIYFMSEDIICESDDVKLNKDDKVIFKVYKDSMGLGAMDVMNEDTPAVEKVVEKEPTPEPKSPKKTSTKKTKKVKKKKAKKTTKRKSKRTKKNSIFA